MRKFPDRNIYRKLSKDPNIRHFYEHKSLSERFFIKVKKEDNGCWKWNGTKNKYGYGMFHVNEFKTDIPAHRASYLIHKGEIPKDRDICHSCDVRECVNPNHLFFGTNLENIKDARKKGRLKLRGRSGLKNKNSIFSKKEVLLIRSMKPYKGFFVKISKKYNVNKYTIRNLFYKKTYKEI